MKNSRFRAFLSRHLFCIVGALAGLVLAILLFTVGLWKTLLLLVLVGVGLYIGWRIDNKADVPQIINRILNEEKQEDDLF